MRILYHISYYKPAHVYGGPVNSTANLCEAMVELGAEVTIITTNANGKTTLEVPLERPVSVNGVQVWYCPLGFTRRYFYSPRLLVRFTQLIERYDITILDAFQTYLLGGTALSAVQAGKPYVIPIRGQLFPWALRQSCLKKYIYLQLFARKWLNYADGLHCTAPQEVEAIQNLGITAPTFIVPNSFDLQAFSRLPVRGEIRKRFNISPHATVLVQIGRVISIKRPDISIKTLARLQNAHLIFVGPYEISMRDKLTALARAHDCHERVHFAELLDTEGVKQALVDADLLLMPSEIQENFGLAAAEALAAGIPVLTSTGIPIGVWAMQEGAGLAVECHHDTFAIAAQRLLGNPIQLEQMRKKTRAFMQRFDKHIVARQMLDQYEQILTKYRDYK